MKLTKIMLCALALMAFKHLKSATNAGGRAAGSEELRENATEPAPTIGKATRRATPRVTFKIESTEKTEKTIEAKTPTKRESRKAAYHKMGTHTTIENIIIPEVFKQIVIPLGDERSGSLANEMVKKILNQLIKETLEDQNHPINDLAIVTPLKRTRVPLSWGRNSTIIILLPKEKQIKRAIKDLVKRLMERLNALSQ